MEKDEKKEEMVDENKENGESSCEDGNQIWRCSCGNYNLPEDLYCSACGSKKKPSIEQSVERIEESPVKKQDSNHLFTKIKFKKQVDKNGTKQDSIDTSDDAKTIDNLLGQNEENTIKLKKIDIDAAEKIKHIGSNNKSQKKELNTKSYKIIGIVAIGAAVVIALLIIPIKIISPELKYKSAVSKMNEGEYIEAIDSFRELGDYKDSLQKIAECENRSTEAKYNEAVTLASNERYNEAIELFSTLNGYSDSNAKIEECNNKIIQNRYDEAETLFNNGKYDEAYDKFCALNGYADSKEKAVKCQYNMADVLFNEKKYDEAYSAFSAIEYNDSADKAKECQYQIGLGLWEGKQYDDSNPIFARLGNYKDSKEKIHKHDYKETIVKKPNCTDKGEKQYVCDCGNCYSEDIPAIGHSYSQEVIVKQPTCTENGIKAYQCVCGDSKTETIPAFGHQYTSQLTKEATCQNEGIITYSCQCGDSYTETIPRIEHDFSGGSCWEPATCIYCGKQKGNELGHTTKKGICSRCGLYIRDGEEWDSYEDWHDYKYDYDYDDYDSYYDSYYDDYSYYDYY